jgi:hypothetical protein
MKSKTIIFIIALLSVFSLAQSQDDQFNSLITALQGEIKTVNSAKLVYEQEINIEQPGVIDFVLTTIDQKGNSGKIQQQAKLC